MTSGIVSGGMSCWLAFDDEREFQEFLDERNGDLEAKQRAEQADPREHVSGVVREPGHRLRAQNQRLLRRALEHGVWPPGWDPRDPPDGISTVTAGDPDRPA
ncbi:MAG: hypothetical protein ACRDQD_17370 [Nocardioidaceae bacterium]